jgi:predicted P-loop ATPase
VYDKEVCPLVLVLSGDQGNGKSSFIRNVLPKELGDDYFLEERIDGNNKDSKIKMGQHLLLCDEEFGGMATKDVKAFKSLADLRVIDERQAYRANSEIWKRRALLGGTTNERTILKDVTGNRRILPIDTYAGKGMVDYNGVIKFDNKKLILEAYKLYKEGFDWRIFSKEDMEYLNSTNEQFEESEPFGDIFFSHFSVEKTDDFCSSSHMNTGEIINWFGNNTSMKANKHNIEDMMRKNGNIKKQPVKINGKSVRAYRLYSKMFED